MTSDAGTNRLGQGIEAMQSAALDPPTRERRSPWRFAWWLVFIAGSLYFILPLIGTFAFSLKAQPFGAAYTGILDDPAFFSTLIYSFVVGFITIIVSIAIILPTAFWVRLRIPRARPFIEFITLLPFVVPPIVLVFGLIQTYSRPPLPFTHTNIGSTALLVCAYVVLSFPYMYRSIDTGLRSIDVQSLTEAAQSLGAGWIRILAQVIFPNLRVSLLSGAFLTLAIVVGEFTVALFLARPVFAVYLSRLGDSAPYQQSAVALISFGLTWIAMGFIAVLGRGGRGVPIAGAR